MSLVVTKFFGILDAADANAVFKRDATMLFCISPFSEGALTNVPRSLAGAMRTSRLRLQGYEDEVFENLHKLEAQWWRPQSLAHHGERVLKARDEMAKNIVAYHDHLARVGYVRKTIGTTILAVSILDRYLMLRRVTEQGVVAAGWAAYWLAAKYDNGLAGVGWAVRHELERAGATDLPAMEVNILRALKEETGGRGWKLDLPTPFSFLEPFLTVTGHTLGSRLGRCASDTLESSLS